MIQIILVLLIVHFILSMLFAIMLYRRITLIANIVWKQWNKQIWQEGLLTDDDYLKRSTLPW